MFNGSPRSGTPLPAVKLADRELDCELLARNTKILSWSTSFWEQARLPSPVSRSSQVWKSILRPFTPPLALRAAT